MSRNLMPVRKPLRPEFSSGPCAKRPGWDLKQIVQRASLGRSHRAKKSKAQIQTLLSLTKKILEIPDSYRVGLVPASNTGAFELAMWTLLGKLPVEIFAWEKFGLTWANDIIEQLDIVESRVISAAYGQLPNLMDLRIGSDICFTWNGTTSGARVPNADWLPNDLEGLVLCDATSAVFSQRVDWKKLDATTFSWQKAMGGEAGHGMLVLSPKAVDRLENFDPDRPLPKIFRLVNDKRLIEGIFAGETINTPSMLCVADALDSLEWMQSLGGLDVTISRADENFRVLQNWLDEQDWIDNLVSVTAFRSNTSVCLKIVNKDFLNLSIDQQRKFIKHMVKLLEMEAVAFDIGGHRAAPPGLRIWCGATVENTDLLNLLPWLKWAYDSSKFLLGNRSE